MKESKTTDAKTARKSTQLTEERVREIVREEIHKWDMELLKMTSRLKPS